MMPGAAGGLHQIGHVLAGQAVGHTGDAAGLGRGHIEIGFSDGSGDPLNHHGAIAWTPSGAAMRTVLVAPAERFASLRKTPGGGSDDEP